MAEIFLIKGAMEIPEEWVGSLHQLAFPNAGRQECALQRWTRIGEERYMETTVSGKGKRFHGCTCATVPDAIKEDIQPGERQEGSGIEDPATFCAN